MYSSNLFLFSRIFMFHFLSFASLFSWKKDHKCVSMVQTPKSTFIEKRDLFRSKTTFKKYTGFQQLRTFMTFRHRNPTTGFRAVFLLYYIKLITLTVTDIKFAGKCHPKMCKMCTRAWAMLVRSVLFTMPVTYF